MGAIAKSTITNVRPGSSGIPKAFARPPSESPMQDRESQEGQHRRFEDALGDMAEFIMAELMRENRKDFFLALFLQKRIEEDDTLGLAETGEISIAMRRSFRRIHDEEAFGFESAFGEKRFDMLLESRIRHGREFVEQWRDEGRIDDEHRQHHHHEAGPAEEPPKMGHRMLESEEAIEQRNGQDELKRDALDLVAKKHPRRRSVEAELGLEPKGADDREGKIEDIADRRDENDQGNAARQARRDQVVP